MLFIKFSCVVAYNLSSHGKEGVVQVDERGPWNSEPTFKYIADPLIAVFNWMEHNNSSE